jgi:hypothetical protein
MIKMYTKLSTRIDCFCLLNSLCNIIIFSKNVLLGNLKAQNDNNKVPNVKGMTGMDALLY